MPGPGRARASGVGQRPAGSVYLKPATVPTTVYVFLMVPTSTGQAAVSGLARRDDDQLDQLSESLSDRSSKYRGIHNVHYFT